MCERNPCNIVLSVQCNTTSRSGSPTKRHSVAWDLFGQDRLYLEIRGRGNLEGPFIHKTPYWRTNGEWLPSRLTRLTPNQGNPEVVFVDADIAEQPRFIRLNPFAETRTRHHHFEDSTSKFPVPVAACGRQSAANQRQ